MTIHFPERAKVASVLDVDALGLSQVPYLVMRAATYGRTVLLGNDDFVTALDARTGALLWRSEPRVSRTNLVVIGDVVIAAFGFEDREGGRVSVIDARTGEVLQRERFQGAPEGIVLEKGAVSILTEGSITTFALR